MAFWCPRSAATAVLAAAIAISMAMFGGHVALDTTMDDDYGPPLQMNDVDPPQPMSATIGSQLMQRRTMKVKKMIANATDAAHSLKLVGRTDIGSPDDALPPLTRFSFAAAHASPLAFSASGDESVTLSGSIATECQANLKDEDALGDLLLVKLKYGGHCYPWPAYSNSDYKVKSGIVANNLPAYMVHPAQKRASAFVAGGTGIYYRFPEKKDYVVYALENGVLVKVGEVLADSIIAGVFVKTGVNVDQLTSPTPYLLLPSETAVPVPAARTLSGTEATQCDMDNIGGAALGDVALVTVKRGRHCWTDGRYNSRAYLIESGTLSGGSSGASVPAYRIHPPSNPATSFVASNTRVYFRVPDEWHHDLVLWEINDAGEAKQTVSISRTSTQLMGFVDTGILADQLTASVVLAPITNGAGLSNWSPVSATADGALLASGEGFSVTARRFQIAGHDPHPFVPAKAAEGGDWAYGPGQHSANYGIPKKFFPTERSDGREGVIWQDQQAFTIHATWLSVDLLSAETRVIYTETDAQLVAVAFNGADDLVLLLVDRSRPADRSQNIPVKVVKVQCMTGETLATKSLDTSSSGLDVARFTSSGASMVWNAHTGMVGVVLSRLMTNRHQGAIAFVLDDTTLEIQTKFWTASHSFGNSMLLASDGSFISMDLGDNYPRGINLCRFDSTSKACFKPYAFKTHHAGSANGREKYEEISTPEKTYYKWSNDNYVYTELGHAGVVEVDDGLLIFFSGEQPPLDNSVVGSLLNVARNAGFVKISKDLSKREVLSPGPTETGGFYDFGGGWQTQENKGINFLTNFNSVEESVSRLKTASLENGKILLYWEVWSKTTYKYTQMMIVNHDGIGQTSPWALNYTTLTIPVRLPIQDDFYIKGGRAVAYAGAPGGLLMRYELKA